MRLSHSSSKALVALAFIIALAMPIAGAYEIEGNSVTYEDTNINYTATPHTLTSDGWVEIEFTSKQYTGNVDVAFGFDTDSSKPLGMERWTGSQWVTFGSNYEVINYDYDGKDRWYFLYDKPIVEDVNYKVRVWMDINEISSGKYDFAIKPSGETLSQAIANGHFYLLDPWWNSSYQFKQNLTFLSNATSNTIVPCIVNGTGGGFNLSNPDSLQIVWTTCRVDSTDEYLYYNNNSEYAVANDTSLSIMNFDIEYGNSTSYNATGLWEDFLTARYELDSNGDDSTGDYDGVESSATYTDGIFWKSFQSTDPNYIEISSDVITDKSGSNDFSINMWIKSGGDQGQNRILASFRDNSANVVQLFMTQQRNDGTLYAFIRDATSNSCSLTTVGTGYELDGLWHMFTLVKDGNNCYLYIDGGASSYGETISDTTAVFSGGFALADTLRIGHDTYSTNTNGFQGYIDEFQIYERALSEDEAIALYELNIGGYLGAIEEYNATNETGGNETNETLLNYTCPGDLFDLDTFCVSEWTSATCSDNSTLTLIGNCTMEWIEGTDNNICQAVRTKNVHCPNGCYEGIDTLGAGCSPPDYWIYIIGFIVAIMGFIGIERFGRKRGKR